MAFSSGKEYVLTALRKFPAMSTKYIISCNALLSFKSENNFLKTNLSPCFSKWMNMGFFFQIVWKRAWLLWFAKNMFYLYHWGTPAYGCSVSLIECLSIFYILMSSFNMTTGSEHPFDKKHVFYVTISGVF